MFLTVTIVTIAYNSEKEIRRTIESVLNQTVAPLEYYIIDGASSDRTVKIAESYKNAMKEKGIRYHICSEPDHGIYDAMNKGIHRASGAVTGLINSGDWYEKEAIETILEVFRNTDCELIYGNLRMHKKNGGTFIKKSRQRKYQTSRDWNHPTMFVKTEVYKKYSFRCKGIHDDYGTFLQMKKAGVRIETVDKVLADFSMGGVSNKKSLKASIKRIKDRYYWCYRVNGYSRFYLIECIMTEAVKMLFG